MVLSSSLVNLVGGGTVLDFGLTGVALDGVGLDGTGLDGVGLDGTGLDGTGLDGVDLSAKGCFFGLGFLASGFNGHVVLLVPGE